jgi:hypothetical protein
MSRDGLRKIQKISKSNLKFLNAVWSKPYTVLRSIGTACVSPFVHPDNGRKTPDNGHCPPRQWIFVDNGRFVSLFLSIEEASLKMTFRSSPIFQAGLHVCHHSFKRTIGERLQTIDIVLRDNGFSSTMEGLFLCFFPLKKSV